MVSSTSANPHHRVGLRGPRCVRRWDEVEFGAVAKALKVDPVESFTQFVRAS